MANPQWSGHEHFGYDLVRNLNSGAIVELGSAAGTSLFSFAQVAKDSAAPISIYAVDT